MGGAGSLSFRCLAGKELFGVDAGVDRFDGDSLRALCVILGLALFSIIIYSYNNSNKLLFVSHQRYTN